MMQSTLLNEIEQCRKDMIELSKIYPLTSKAVLEASERLDVLLNRYQEYKMESSY